MTAQRVQPHDLEAERAVLGSVLLDSVECWPIAAAVVRAEHFYSRPHELLWAAFAVCGRAGNGFDETAARGELKRAGTLDETESALHALLDRLPDPRNVERHAETVRNLSVIRDVARKASELANRAYSGSIGDLGEYLDEAEHALARVCEARALPGELHSMRDVMTRTFEDITARADAKGGAVGHSTGFEVIDRILSGLQDGMVYVVAGRPGMGKTAWALNVMRNVVDSAQKPGIFFSLEMPVDQLGARLLASEALVDGNKLRFAKFDRADWPRLAAGSGTLSEIALFVDDTSQSLDDICRVARRKHREAGGLAAIAVDYLQLMRSGKGDNREQEISHMSRSLKLLAKELRCPVLELSQLNRGVESRPDKRPMISDLRESGAIEQDADTIIFVYRDEHYHPDTPDRGLAEIIVGKQRGGPTGVEKMVWRKEFTKFENYDGRHGGGSDDSGPPDDHTAERYG